MTGRAATAMVPLTARLLVSQARPLPKVGSVIVVKEPA